MNFASDNAAAISPEILRAIEDVNSGFAKSYGSDELSEKLRVRLCEIFESDVRFFFTSTGTAANCLAISAVVPSYSMLYCHREAHINTDECGAYGLLSGGMTLFPTEGAEAKIDLDSIKSHITFHAGRKPHTNKPGAITITQATELGAVYSLGELKAIGDFARSRRLPLHMDGARFANALVSLGCAPAECTWKSGVDVMSLGATKNGCLIAEMVLFFNTALAEDFAYIHKRAGQLMSKTRYLSAQWIACFEDDLWLRNAKNANSMAQRLSDMLRQKGLEVVYPVQANEVFVKMPSHTAEDLWKRGAKFYPWDEDGGVYRMVTSFSTRGSEIECLEGALRKQSVRV